MSYELLRVERIDSVEWVTLNRPHVRNAFNQGMIEELAGWAHATAADPAIRVAVLAGNGPVFSAGADLEWLSQTANYSRDEYARDAEALGRMLHRLDTLPQPLVGCVRGAALGGGAGLLSVCDIVIAAEDAVFGFTEVRLGIVPAMISPFVVAKIGISAARETFLTGSRFGAARAQQIGLVHEVVPPAELEDAAARRVGELLACGPEAVAAAKALIRTVAGRPAPDVLQLTAAVLADRRASAEGREGMRAFLEKKRPPWGRPS